MNIVLKTAYYLFLGAILLVGVLLVLSFMNVGGVVIKVVKSGSMEPAIKTGSIVVIRPEILSPYAVGDVITFGKDTRTQIPTTHRIIEMRTESGEYVYRVKGDANNAPDVNEVRGKDVIGRVLFSVPYVGYILDMAKKPIGFVFLVVLPACLIIFDELSNIWVEIRNRNRTAIGKPPTQNGNSANI